MAYVHITGARFTNEGSGCFFVANQPPPTPAEIAEQRRFQDAWLTACERNQGLAIGSHPVRVAVLRSRAEEDRRQSAAGSLL